MKRIVICTLYDSVNCGTYLQAFSMKKILEKMGFEVFFLELKNDNSKITNPSSIKSMSFKEIIIKVFRKIRLQFVFRKSRNNFKTMDLSEVNNDPSIKYIIVGSDEIWNVRNNSFEHYKEFFGYNFINKKIIAYAPSSNDTTKNDLVKEFGDINFNNFDRLSARDKKTKDLIYQFINKNIKVCDVLDPTMIVDSLKDIYENTYLKNYIVVYGHSFTDEQIDCIITFAKHKKLQTVSITKYFEWCDKNIVVSPGKFLSYIKNADYIITSTFHGSVFSILYEKQFAVYTNNGSKIVDLLEKFNLKNRIVNNNIENILDRKINYNDTKNILKELREKSIKYLEESLKGEE